MNHQDLIAVLLDARELLERPENEFSWSSWKNSNQAMNQVDGLLDQLEAGSLPKREALERLFLPTGGLQEVGLSSGWGDEFLELADVFNAVMLLYPSAEVEPCGCLTTPHQSTVTVQELGFDSHRAEVSVLICQQCDQLWLLYFYELEAITASGRWFLGAISPDQLSSLNLENAKLLLETLDWYFFGGSYFKGHTGKTSGQILL
jgi:hypothetical protein